ncbi:hypothetical protein B484DRAFT_455420 [Ochromonadaceae sp. CCMP2298]|nr:hypothetical protein B484DRAFT_455420 [Ochromonadaceae sp. CCMP2298]
MTSNGQQQEEGGFAAMSKMYGNISVAQPHSIDNTQNKRIHVKFTRYNRMLGCATEQAQTILNRVWAKFGTASHIHYPEWSFCFLSFGSHDEAEAAMHGMNDLERFTAAALEVLKEVAAELQLEMASASNNQQKEATRQKAIKASNVANLLGRHPFNIGEVIIRASWASPSPSSRSRYSRH